MLDPPSHDAGADGQLPNGSPPKGSLPDATPDAALDATADAALDATADAALDATADAALDATADAALDAALDATADATADAALDADGGVEPFCSDHDGDGYGEGCSLGEDCNDQDPFVAPGMIDFPDDGVDQDCVGGDLVGATLNAVYLAAGADGIGTADDPLGSLAEAVELAGQRGVPVFIAAGTYEGTTINVSLYGGYDAADWTRNRLVQETIIQGQVNAYGNSAGLVVEAEVSLVLDGLTIRGADIVEGTTGYSMGLRLQRARGITVAFCTIEGGLGKGDSIGLWVNDGEGSLTVHSSRISGKEGYQTRAVYSNVDLTLYGNTLEAGHAPEHGTIGLFLVTGPAARVVNNVIEGGSGFRASGGAISPARDTLSEEPERVFWINNLIRCRTGGTGTAVGFWLLDDGTAAELAEVVFINNIFTNEIMVDQFVAIYSQAGQMRLLHNLLDPVATGEGRLVASADGNVLTQEELNDCDNVAWPAGRCLESAGNQAADPHLEGNYLRADSPGIDHGTNPAPWYNGVGVAVDLLGQTRPLGGTWDVGPYESVPD